MSKFGIPEPCQEDWGGMKHNQDGAFCQSCAKQVYDTTEMTKTEIMGLMQRFNPLPCLKMTVRMHEEIADDFTYWQASQDKSFQKRFMLALIVVFGISLLSCQNEPQREVIQQIQNVGQVLVQEETKVPDPSEKPNEMIAKADKAICEQKTLTGEVVEFIDTSENRGVEVVAHTTKRVDVVLGRQQVVRAGVPLENIQVRRFFEEQTSTEIELKYDELGREIPSEYALTAYPNPFQYQTSLKIELPKKTQFQLQVYNLEGKMIRDYGMIEHQPGTFEYDLDLIDAAPGVYLVAFQSTEFNSSKRIVKR